MHGFSPELNIEGFVNEELQQICLGKFDLQFRFSSGTLISVQNKVRLLHAGLLSASWTEENGWDCVEFHALLNVKVSRYEVIDESLLQIEFHDGLLLEFIDDSDQYESMQIYPLGDVSKLIVI